MYPSSLLAAFAELLDGAVESTAQVVRGEAYHLAHAARDARRVGVDVVDGRELRGYLCGESVRKSSGDLTEDVGRRGEGWMVSADLPTVA